MYLWSKLFQLRTNCYFLVQIFNVKILKHLIIMVIDPLVPGLYAYLDDSNQYILLMNNEYDISIYCDHMYIVQGRLIFRRS